MTPEQFLNEVQNFLRDLDKVEREIVRKTDQIRADFEKRAQNVLQRDIDNARQEARVTGGGVTPVPKLSSGFLGRIQTVEFRSTQRLQAAIQSSRAEVLRVLNKYINATQGSIAKTVLESKIAAVMLDWQLNILGVSQKYFRNVREAFYRISGGDYALSDADDIIEEQTVPENQWQLSVETHSRVMIRAAMGQLMESIGNILKSTPKVYAAISDEAAALINPKGRHAALIYRTFSSSELTSLFNKLREAGNGFEDAWGMGSGFRSKEVYIPIPFKGRDLTVFEQAVRDKRKLFRGTLDVRPESIGDVLAALIIIKKTRDERQRERLLQRLVDELSDEQRMNLETILLDLESRGILNKGVWNEALKADIRQRLR